jgi:hypothetical protein
MLRRAAHDKPSAPLDQSIEFVGESLCLFTIEKAEVIDYDEPIAGVLLA